MKNLKNKIQKVLMLASIALVWMGGMSSCQDFLDVDSTYVIDADKDHLGNANDTIYSVIGILNKLQAIADRTVLLGEARGDLLDITSNTSKDLRNLANFNVDDNNKYNNPRDYYAIINNCNYFLAKADTAMENNRGENIFLNEYAVVKAVRAWTYLQLVTTYGEVPFVTEPIMTKEDADKTYPKKDIKAICDYFINEDGLQALADNENVTYPYYRDIKGTPSRLYFFPLNLVLGDLYLWQASYTNQKSDYLEAAKRYYAYISKRNGTTTASAYPTTSSSVQWMDDTWKNISDSWSTLMLDESNSANSEVISIIPMDSVRSEGYYSELREIFCSDYNENNQVSLVPSKYMKDLSAAQDYCYYDRETQIATIVPKGLQKNLDGDLRLASCWSTDENAVDGNGKRYTSQSIYKFMTKNGNVNIYRRSLVYLRLAEAMNCAGYPRFAFSVLQSGLSNEIINTNVSPFYSESDSLMMAQSFSFPNQRYYGTYFDVYGSGVHYSSPNIIGIHSRGCGSSPYNEFYQMPYNFEYANIGEVDGRLVMLPDTPEQIAWQQKQVQELLINENALELAFEGYRFYDLMRIAIRNNDPSYLANKINARKGAGISSGISVDLTDKKNWFLNWNGQIGL